MGGHTGMYFVHRYLLSTVGGFFVTVRGGVAYGHLFHAAGKFCDN